MKDIIEKDASRLEEEPEGQEEEQAEAKIGLAPQKNLKSAVKSL